MTYNSIKYHEDILKIVLDGQTAQSHNPTVFFSQNGRIKKYYIIYSKTYLAHIRVVIPMLEKSLKLVEVPCRCKEWRTSSPQTRGSNIYTLQIWCSLDWRGPAKGNNNFGQLWDFCMYHICIIKSFYTRLQNYSVKVETLNLTCAYIYDCFMLASCGGSVKTAQMRSLIWAFTVCICDKYLNLTLLIFILSYVFDILWSKWATKQ